MAGHPAKVTFPFLPPSEAGSPFSDREGKHCQADLFYVKAVWLEIERRDLSIAKSNAQLLSINTITSNLYKPA